MEAGLRDRGETISTARILVVDDQEDNRILLNRRLARLGHEVETVPDGPSALRAVRRTRPDVILLDQMMPGMSGLETLEILRRDYSRSELPVIMVTAQTDEDLIARALDSGANDFVAKPISFRVLVARMEPQIERMKSERAMATLNERLEALVESRTAKLQRRNEELAAANERALQRETQYGALRLALAEKIVPTLQAIATLVEGVTSAGGPPQPFDRIRGEVNRCLLMLRSWADDPSGADDGGAPGTSDFDVAALVRDAVAAAAESARADPSRFDVTGIEDTGPLNGVPAALGEAVAALAGNALRFSPAREAIVVSTGVEGGEIAIRILDRGPGMPVDPPRRSDVRASEAMTSIAPERFGLRLSKVKMVAERHAGRLLIENRRGGGLCAEIRLPRKPAQDSR